MKNKIILSALLGAALCSSGCLEEAFPENGTMTSEQVKGADMAKLAAAVPGYMLSYGGSFNWDIGFASNMIWRDVMTADMPVYSIGYDYFTNFNYQLVIGDMGPATYMWRDYYTLIMLCNKVLAATGTDVEPTAVEAPYAGTALAYRVMAYSELAREFEWKRCGIASLDDEATSRGIWGLTAPIVTETTTENDTRTLPRAPFWQMYRFILTDLDHAEAILAETHQAEATNYACLGLIYGFQARMWLELGSRFLQANEDLQLALANEEENPELRKLNITSAYDCFELAAECAQKAINEGFTPVTEGQWFNPSSGFNTPTQAWMFSINITPDNALARDETWKSWVSFMSPEATYGVACDDYQATKQIDARLFSQIDGNDWRRATWIAPGDSASLEAYTEKYSRITSLTFDEWSAYAPYCGFKWHPAGGDRNTASNGNAVSIPLMRIEEMWLIQAEALAYANPGAGAAKLEQFMNAYRMNAGTTYTCPAADVEGVVDAIWTQKRIEFWGEGIVYWDYKRRNLAITRGYPGTNHPDVFRYNSYPNAVAPWLNFYFPDRSHNLNEALILNPDPSGAIPESELWTPSAQ